MAASPGVASTSFWAGGNGNWSSNVNPGWNGGGVPNGNDDVAAHTSATSSTTTQNVAAGVTVQRIYLSGSSNVSWSHTLTNKITIDAPSSVFTFIQNLNSSTGSSNSLTLGAGTLTLAGNPLLISNEGGSTSANGAVRINSTIGGTAEVRIENVGSNNASAGAIHLQAANTFTGDVGIQAGAVTFGHRNSFGNAGNEVSMGFYGYIAGIGQTLVSTTTVGTVPNDIVVGTTFSPMILGSTSAAISGNTTYAGAIRLFGDLSLTSSNTGTAQVVLSSVVSGFGALKKVGAGNATLSGANTYTGGTSALEGTLFVSGNQSAADGGWSIGPSNAAATTVNFNAGSTIAVASDKEVRIGNNVSAGSVAQTLNVAGTVTNNGTLYVGRSVNFNINSGGAWTQHGAMSLNGEGGGARTLIIDDGQFTYSGSTPIAINPGSGNSRLTVGGGGAITTGQGFASTIVSSIGTSRIRLGETGVGTLKLSADIPSLVTTAGSTFHFQVGAAGGVIDTNGYSTTMNGVVSNVDAQVGALIKTGTGTLTLSANNTYTGGSTVSGGHLLVEGDQTAATGGWRVGSDAIDQSSQLTFASGSTAVIASGKTVRISSDAPGSANGSFQYLESDGTVTNNGTLHVGRYGTLNVNNGKSWTQYGAMAISPVGENASTVFNQGSFTYAGSTPISISPATGSSGNALLNLLSGTFTTGQPFSNVTASSGGSTKIRLGSGGGSATLKLSANIPSLASTAGSEFLFQLGGGGGIINTNGFSTTMSLPIGDSPGDNGLLTKQGLGTLTLTGANTYTGGTIVEAGVVNVSGNQTAANGGWSIGPNATMAAAVNFSSGLIAVASGKQIRIGNNVAGGSAPQSLYVTNVVTNDGSLYLGSSASLDVRNTWTQNGAMSINAHGGADSIATIYGGSLSYAGPTPIEVNPANGASGSATLTVAGEGILVTGQGFINNTATSAGSASVRFGDTNVADGKGTLRLSADIPTLVATAGGALKFELGAWGGVLDTNGFSTAMNGEIGNVAGQNGSLTKTGAGTLKLAANNTYGGVTVISGGTLQIGDGGTTGTLGAGSVSNNGTLAFHRADFFVHSSIISGSGDVVQNGDGSITANLALTAANTYDGVTTINSGALHLIGSGALGSTVGGTIVNDGGRLTISTTNVVFENIAARGTGGGVNGAIGFFDGATLAGSLTLTDHLAINVFDSGAPATAIISGVIGDGGAAFGFTVNGLLGPSQTLRFSGASANTYGGLTTVASGSLALNKPAGVNAIAGDGAANTVDVVVNGGATLRNLAHEQIANDASVNLESNGLWALNDRIETIGALVGVGNVDLGNGDLWVGSSDQSSLFSGAIGGGGGIRKVGAGTWTIDGDNLYTGSTFVEEGTLIVNGTHALAGGYQVTNGATLGGAGVINADLTVFGAVAPGDSVGALTVNGNYSQQSNGSLEIELASPTNFDSLATSGQITLGGGTLAVSLLNGYSPEVGAEFDVLDFTVLSGAFQSINLPTLSPGLLWDASQLYSTGVLSVIHLPADFNYDGEVDGEDLAYWRDDFGASARSDADGDGDSDGGDFLAWQRQLGAVQGAVPATAAASAAVPEPKAAGLLFGTILLTQIIGDQFTRPRGRRRPRLVNDSDAAFQH